MVDDAKELLLLLEAMVTMVPWLGVALMMGCYFCHLSCVVRRALVVVGVLWIGCYGCWFGWF